MTTTIITATTADNDSIGVIIKMNLEGAIKQLEKTHSGDTGSMLDEAIDIARLLDNDFDVDYYIKNYPFAKSLERVGNRVEGDFNEMKEFLNKLTWGMDSLPREICERINFLTCHQWADLLTESGFNIISINAYMQPSYFYHLQKVAEISNTWETHVLIVAEKK